MNSYIHNKSYGRNETGYLCHERLVITLGGKVSEECLRRDRKWGPEEGDGPCVHSKGLGDAPALVTGASK
jgi:hypothetical protein